MKLPRVVSVSSGKGGVGKTLFAVSLAHHAARNGQRALLVDADLGLANAEVVLGIAPAHTLDDVLQGRADVHDAITPARPGLDLLSGGSGLPRLVHLAAEERRVLLDALHEAALRYDLVVLDVAAGIGENVLYFVALSDTPLVVLSPDPTSLTDAYALVKVLSRERGLRHFFVVVNQASPEEGERAFRQLLAVADRYLDVVLRYLGAFPSHTSVRDTIRRQVPLAESAPGWLVETMDALCARLLQGEPPAVGPMHLFWEAVLEHTLIAGGRSRA